MSAEEQDQLLKQSQDVALTGTVLSGLYRELSNGQWDALVESIGKEVYELVRRRVEEKREGLEAAEFSLQRLPDHGIVRRVKIRSNEHIAQEHGLQEDGAKENQMRRVQGGNRHWT